MSSVSVTSSNRREKTKSELLQELEAIRSLNNSLKTCLQNFKAFKQNLVQMNDNMDVLQVVNKEWVDTLGSAGQSKKNKGKQKKKS